MKYTAEDFRNARFATHPDGRFAARVDQGDTVLNWVVNEHSGYGWRADQEMADEEWKPVSAGRRITESEARERLANEGIAFAVIFNQALRWAGVKIHPDPEPTNAQKILADLDGLNGDGFLIHDRHKAKIASHLANLGWAKREAE